MTSEISFLGLLTTFLYTWTIVNCSDVIVCPEDCEALESQSVRLLCYTRCEKSPFLAQQDDKMPMTSEQDGLQSDSALQPNEFEISDQSPHYRFRRTANPIYRLVDDSLDSSSQGGYSKRASSFVRIGRSLPPWGKRVSSFVRIGRSNKYDSDETVNDKRASSFVRIGKSADAKFMNSLAKAEHAYYPSDVQDKRASSFVRIGKNFDSAGYPTEKRAASFVRIGKADQLTDANMEKRTSSFVRIGKSEENTEDKRASSFVRIGKAADSSEDKRASSFVRIGRSNENNLEEKRASSFVRIGKSDPVTNEIEKKASSFVRIGKGHLDELHEEKMKKASSFVRIG